MRASIIYLYICLFAIKQLSAKLYRRSNYDKTVNVFSHDGELFQVNYAKEASLRGDCVTAVKLASGDVLVSISSQNQSPNYLLDRRSVDKVSKVDSNIWIAFSGLVGDGIDITRRVREFCVEYYSKFGLSPSVLNVASDISEMQHQSTLIGGYTV